MGRRVRVASPHQPLVQREPPGRSYIFTIQEEEGRGLGVRGCFIERKKGQSDG